MKLTEHFLTKNRCYTTQQKTIKPVGLILHSVATPQPNADVFIRGWNNPEASKSVHALIDGHTGEVVQTLPWNYRAWHCGSPGNNTHIGVEMCEPKGIQYNSNATRIVNVTDVAEAQAGVKTTYKAAVELFAYLCQMFGFDPITDILSHKEAYARGIASNHGDPDHLWRGLHTTYTMDGFRADVKREMEKAASAPVAESDTNSDTSDTKTYTKEVYTMKQIKMGVNGTTTAMMQGALAEMGFYTDKVDGKAGPNTDKAIRAFQTKHGLTVDGIFGKKSWAKLFDLL